jgi:hypothetical protein
MSSRGYGASSSPSDGPPVCAASPATTGGAVHRDEVVLYSRKVGKATAAPWEAPPADPFSDSAPNAPTSPTADGPWAEPAELVAARASVEEAQERVDLASRQLALAEELEARLQMLLQEPSGPETTPLPSPERQAAELEATGILLEAELRAAKILNGSGTPGNGGADNPRAVTAPVARAVEDHLLQLIDLEVELAQIARALVPQEVDGPGLSSAATDKGSGQLRGPLSGGTTPVPLVRRSRRRKA